MTFRPRYFRFSKWVLFWADSPGMYAIQWWLSECRHARAHQGRVAPVFSYENEELSMTIKTTVVPTLQSLAFRDPAWKEFEPIPWLAVDAPLNAWGALAWRWIQDPRHNPHPGPHPC